MNEAGASVVATQLLAFHADPVRYRARLTHGREVLPGGIHVFRFAQGRFPHGVMTAFSSQDRDRIREAANFYIRQVCFWDGATHYQVLGVAPDATHRAIKEHYHGQMALIHPDRHDADSEQWPEWAAQRVNRAYAVLSDDGRRREYDALLGRSVPESWKVDGVEPQVSGSESMRGSSRGKATAARIGFGRQALIVLAVLAGLFYIHAWWAAELPEEYSALESATSIELSRKWMRDVLAPALRPRFLEVSGRPQALLASLVEPEAGSFKALVSQPAERATSPLPPAPAQTPSTGTPREAGPETGLGAGSRPARVDQPKAAAKGTQLRHAAGVVSRGAPTSPLADGAPRDLELLVARLVSHYESGELDQLLALFDAGSVGVIEAMNLRRDFEEFFRATRMRRLQLRTVSWEAGERTTKARGEALLRAEYHDSPDRVERVLRLELEATMLDGRPRIARLVLFPHE